MSDSEKAEKKRNKKHKKKSSRKSKIEINSQEQINDEDIE